MAKELLNGIENAVKRGTLKAVGISATDLEKPNIAIISISNDISPSQNCTENFVSQIQKGIFEGGANAIKMHISSVTYALSIGSTLAKYEMPNREWIANNVETLLASQPIDGVVLVADGGSIIAGMIIGAIRVNLPTIVFSTGTMSQIYVDNKMSSLSQLLSTMGACKAGKQHLDILTSLQDNIYEIAGTDGDFGTTNTMNAAVEALGLSLSENSTLAANASERKILAKKTGLIAANITKENLTIKMLLSKESFINSFAFTSAVGCECNTILHLLALSTECGYSITYKELHEIFESTPLLCKISPLGEYGIQDFGQAGGVKAVLKELSNLTLGKKSNLIDKNAKTVQNLSLGDIIENSNILDTNIISSAKDPIDFKSGIGIILGNIAENGALYKRALIDNKKLVFVGVAKVFDSEEDAIDALFSRRIVEGDVIVVRFEGAKGGPGMRMLILPAFIEGAGLAGKVALITDARLCDVGSGICIGHASPEAFDSGKIALIKDGDKITIDLVKNKIEFDILAKELANRQKKFDNKDITNNGCLKQYNSLATCPTIGLAIK